MPQPTSYTPQSSSNPSDSDEYDRLQYMTDKPPDDGEEYCWWDYLETEDFWYDEEDRHELF